jgi:hypothetical protein
MLQDRQVGLPADRWIDKLAPKVAHLREVLKEMRPEEVAWRSGATLRDDRLHLHMLFQPYEVDLASYVVSKPGGGDVASFTQSLVLTYLEMADGAPPADRWISFRELPNGGFYHRAFQGYAPDRLTKRWGLDIDGFVEACRAVGGTRFVCSREWTWLPFMGWVTRIFPHGRQSFLTPMRITLWSPTAWRFSAAIWSAKS